MSLLAPLGLLLALAAVPLVALYVLKIRRQRVKVPSLLLWQAFAKTEKLATPFERFKRNLLLLLQLLILLFLVLAFARPFLAADVAVDRSVVLVVDTTASMGATDEEPTRLGRAVREAIDVVDGLGDGDEVMLVVVGPQTEVQVPFTRTHDDVRGALRALVATEAEGSLRDGLRLALSLGRSRPGVEVVVFSDGGNENLREVSDTDAAVSFVAVGYQATNAGIIALDLRSSPASDLDRQLFVTVQEFGPRQATGTVEVYLGDQLVGLRTETLPPDEPVSMVFDLPAGARGKLRANLDSEGDALPADDQAWAMVNPASRRSVLLVGGDRLTQRVLESDPRVELTRVSTADFTQEMLDDVDCAVFASRVPEGVDGLSYAVLGPVDGAPVKFGPVVERPRVLGWRRTHPVLRFVSWDGVLVSKARTVVDNGGLVAIVESDNTPLVLAGERQGGRVVQLAFDPLDSDLPLRVAYPVMVLNAVGWLTEGSTTGQATRVIPSGTAFVRRLPDGVPDTGVRVIGPDGNDVGIAVADGLVRVQETSRVGVYEVRMGAMRSWFSANLHSAEESRIAPRRLLDLAGDEAVQAQTTVAGHRELWRPLLLFGLIVLLLEWFVWNRRRHG